jgi:ABC-type dipeptide/oligopeptide/nickel transport system ATPase subunit
MYAAALHYVNVTLYIACAITSLTTTAAALQAPVEHVTAMLIWRSIRITALCCYCHHCHCICATQVGLQQLIESLPLTLGANVATRGANFSAGQRQLLCVARAMLTGAHTFVFDEATASVDLQSDTVIQVLHTLHYYYYYYICTVYTDCSGSSSVLQVATALSRQYSVAHAVRVWCMQL